MNMGIENKISYASGFLLTTAYSMGIYEIAMSAAVGLVGGFFGILGKELFYFIKDKKWK
jgi:hypothetical protein|tara:strand:- start:3521 stop:3697 length:177 start_codon:yes stop_codon:yes gene_type:complete